MMGVVCFLAAAPLCAQDIEKEFEAFEKKQQTEYGDFKNKADAEFELFLRETWKKYDASTPIPAPVRPEPVEPVVFVKEKPEMLPVTIKPGALKIPAPESRYKPALVKVPVAVPGRKIRRTPINFYGTNLEVATDRIEHFSLSGSKEADVADAWKELCGKDYEPLLSDCLTLKKEKKLNDWAYLLFTKRIGELLYGEERRNDIAFLQMFLLNKSGYKVRLGKIDGDLKLMFATADNVYAAPFLVMNGDKYYVFESDSKGATTVYTYSQDFADAENLISLNIRSIPAFEMEEQSRTLSSSGGQLKVQVAVNKNLMDFYHDYPQCDLVIHYKAPMSEELRSSLYPQLKKAIEGKSQKDAANLLLNFVQTAFRYKTDGEQFGYEKPNFPDETFYYPYCDCEDRAMLYSALVRDLMGLETVLLDYPNHVATAIRFTEQVTGDAIVPEEGTNYLICDPTYIGASIGTCMEQYKDIRPEVIP